MKKDDIMVNTNYWEMYSLGAFILIWANPFDVLFRSARWDTLVTLYNIFISPFGKVSFKFFFLADVITSMGVTLKDFGYVVFAILDNKWADNASLKKKHPLSMIIFLATVDLIPFWFRYWQCINKWVLSGFTNKSQFYNSLKYVSKMGPGIVCIFAIKYPE